MMMRLLSSAAIAALTIASPAAAQDVIIYNAKIALGDGSEPIESGAVVIDDGKVVYAGTGQDRTFETDTLIDAQGAWVTPGIFATVTTLGLWDVSAVQQSNDIRASDAPFSAALDTAPIVNPNSQHILIHRAAGITRAATTTSPSSSIFGGQGAIIDLDADSNPVMRARAFQTVALGESGGRIAGGSRAAAHTLFRNALREASELGDAARIGGGSLRS
ncbi:MAG: amidohydrolase, partial [Pseudomonadota bacterium]